MLILSGMDPILCHLCKEPLIKANSFHKGHTRWACFNRDRDGLFDLNDESEDLYIVTIPKKKGIVQRYGASIKHNNKCYFLSSYRDLNRTTITRIRYDDFVIDRDGVVPKFYDLKLKEPLAPQFDYIFNNVKLLLTFS
jgi:hypothetical protein